MKLIPRIETERLIHSLKTAIACMIGFSLAKIVGVRADQWIVVTIMIVMCAQIYVGSVVLRGYLRFLGTLAGCVFAAFSLTIFGDSSLTIIFTLAIAGFVFSYIATAQETLMYAGTLGGATTAIIMLGQTPTISLAAERFLEISLGILIASVVSQFVLPLHARTHLRRMQAITLEKMRDYYQACMMSSADQKINAQELDENIIKTLSKQRQLAKEAVREPFGSSYDPKHFVQTLQLEKEIIRSINFMYQSFYEIKKMNIHFFEATSLQTFNEKIIKALDQLIKVAVKEIEEPISIPNISSLKKDFEQNSHLATQTQLLFIIGFLFSAETLSTTLRRLALHYKASISAESIP